MKEQLALSLFHGTEKFNCAQAILKTFQHEAGILESAIREAKDHGGGRAPHGLCGALHSGLSLLQEEKIRNYASEEFTRLAGSTKCREIRQQKKLSCKDCVKLAAQLVEPHLLNVEVSKIAEEEDKEYAL